MWMTKVLDIAAVVVIQVLLNSLLLRERLCARTLSPKIYVWKLLLYEVYMLQALPDNPTNSVLHYIRTI